MTRIDFYRYADDKLRFACRLAAKAFEQSSRLVVYTPDAQVLGAFDRQLWTFQSNHGARRFYERHGFVAVQHTDGDNEEGAPDVRYEWRPCAN